MLVNAAEAAANLKKPLERFGTALFLVGVAAIAAAVLVSRKAFDGNTALLVLAGVCLAAAMVTLLVLLVIELFLELRARRAREQFPVDGVGPPGQPDPR